ncbi:MAG TPA: alkaline phosphatase family protein [Candidatus Dormibacteraeota bacterium]
MARRSKLGLLATGTVVAGVLGVSAAALPAAAQPAAVPSYNHIFVIVEENHGFSDVIGHPDIAPNLNSLASTFGLSTSYFGISHPSEPNYVALLGGSTFGVSSDDAYYTQSVDKPNLMSQMDGAGISWKAYLQGLPHPNYQGICYPANCNGSPDKDPLYASKHDGIQNYTTTRTTADWNSQVPIQQLSSDISANALPRFGYIVPTECDDQHGDPPFCLDGGNAGGADPQDNRLLQQGDQYLGQLVSSLTNAPFWAKGNNAIDITYDEGDDNAGCCDAGSSDPNGAGGGQVANVVITSHGPRHVQDSTPSNHYSLLSTIQQSFGLGCLENSCDTANVKPLLALFAVTGSKALGTGVINPTLQATPTPTPNEPPTHTTLTPSSGGWSVDPAASLGTGDNSLGAVAVTSPTDAWAVGNFLPDDPTSNQDATLTLAEHWNGSNWTVTPTPNIGPNFNTLFGVAGSAAHAWAVGLNLDSAFDDRALVETWDGSAWSVTSVPQPGSQRDILYSVAAESPTNVWAVGDQQGSDGLFQTLVLHFDGSTWRAVPAPDPGSGGNHLYGVTVSGGDVWAVGEQIGAGGFDSALIERFDGSSWHLVNSPAASGAAASTMLFSVTSGGGQVFAAGQSEGSQNGAAPFVEDLTTGGASVETLPEVPSKWSELWGIAADTDHVWAVGTFVDPVTDANNVIVMRRDGANGWHLVGAPDPGAADGGSQILGGIASAAGLTIAGGSYDTGGSRLPLIEANTAG